MDRVLVVGRHSFIAGSILTRFNDDIEIRAISHDVMYDIDMSDVSCVINLSLNPKFKNSVYDESIDADLNVARLAAKHRAHYIMMSSRKVYGISPILSTHKEDDPINPADHYGHNKAISESKIRAELGSSATIVRGSNIFGIEPGRPSFMGWCIDQLLANNTICYDLNPGIKRDFIPVTTACDALIRLAVIKPGGVFNLGSGIATDVGNVATALIQGYGGGSLVVNGTKMHDQFVLDNSKLSSLTGIALWSDDVLESVRHIGRFLCRTW